MICPHCKEPIIFGVPESTIAYARRLRKKGYSLRDIERLLLDKGIRASFVTLSRRLREKK